MPFRPINDNHAVESAGFAITLGRPFNQSEWQEVYKSHHKWTHILPAVTFEVNPNNLAVFGFLKPDGSSSWQMSIQDNQIAIVCNQYTRWKSVKEQVIQLFLFVTDILLKLDDNMPDILSVSYEMKDVFVYNDKYEYKLDSLLKRNTGRLLNSLFESDKYWHQDIGAFIEWSSDLKCLELIKVNSGQVGNRILISLTHVQELRLNEGKVLKLDDLMRPKAQRLSLELEKMHKHNKALLREILVKDIQEEISLNMEIG